MIVVPLAKFSEATTPDAAVPSLKDLRFVHQCVARAEHGRVGQGADLLRPGTGRSAPSGGVQWIVRLASKESSSPTMPPDMLEVLTLPDRAIKVSSVTLDPVRAITPTRPE